MQLLPDPLLAQLSDLIAAQMGLHFPRERLPDLERGIHSAARDLGFEETGDDLIAHYADGSRSVVRQVQRALDNVRDKFRRSQGGRATIDLDYLIYCPSHRLVRVNASALDASRIVDAGSRDHLPARI